MSPVSSLKPLIVLYGDSYVLKRRVLRSLIDQHLAGEDLEYGLEQHWGRESSIAEMSSAIGASSLLAGARLVVLHELQVLPLNEQKPLSPALQRIPPGTVVVITLSPKPDARTKKPPLSAEILKVVEATGEVRDLSTPHDRELPGWVQQEFATLGKSISLPAAQALVKIVGADCDRLANEIVNLSDYVGEVSEVSEQDVRSCAAPAADTDVFALMDAIGRKDVPTALGMVRLLLPSDAKRGEALPLLGMIARHIRLLWQAVVTLNRTKSLRKITPEVETLFPQDQGLKSALRGFLVDKYTAQARNFKESQLARALVKVYETDLALKGMGEQQLDDRTLLETLVISLCRK